MEPRELLIALNATDRITRAALCRLAASVDQWRGIRRADAGRLGASLGVPPRQLRKALDLLPEAAELAAGELGRAARRGERILTLFDRDYPRPLRDHPLPPPVLYCRGRVPERPAVAIVGSRRMSSYGREAAALFGRGLAAAGIAVVSGFALGVDAAAHRAALSVDDGVTVAVLGCGLDVEYPRGNGPLAAEIAERGAVVSEFAYGAEPLPWRFPIRNRIIAALALGTLVVQATLRSGSLITAHQALELGRDVYAVPGSIFDDSARGTNALIADGALVARSPEDVLESLPVGKQRELFPPPPPVSAATGPVTATGPAATVAKLPAGFPGEVLAALPTGDARTAEEIAAAAGASVDRVLGALLELELQGWVRREPGPIYAR